VNPSDIIEQRYRLERLLGTGGMSEVWLAEDTRLGRWVAVKILRDSLANREDELVDTLLQEARVVAKLQHPNIVAVYDFGTHEGHHFLVMEYVHGYSVRQLLQTQGRLTEAEAIRYGTQIATALQYAHEQNVVHCDVKPENILVNEQGVAKVADFGVAESVSRTLAPEQMRDVLGTVAYLAPEVIQGAPAEPRADVYSLGLTVYEMAAGRLPFTGTNPAALAGQRLGAPAPPLRAFAMSASPELESVLARALAISPQDRYSTAGAFANALRNVPAGTSREAALPAPIVAPPGRAPAAPRHNTARVRRGAPPPNNGWSSTGIAALVGAVLLALGIGIAAAVILSQDDDDNGGGDGTPTTEPTQQTQTAETASPTGETPATSTPTVTRTPTSQPTTPATATATATRTPTQAPTEATATTPATASPSVTQQPLLPSLPTIPPPLDGSGY
jgi:serine/threonine-protein kinase